MSKTPEKRLRGRPKGARTMSPEARQIIYEVFQDKSITIAQATEKVLEELRSFDILPLPSNSAIMQAYMIDRRNDGIYINRDQGRKKGPRRSHS